MAREIHEREDLLRDAKALVPRIQLRLTHEGSSLEVFAGFRGVAFSLYIGDDPVYHFNGAHELRRAFVDDRLIKAEKGKLVAWSPDRNEERTDMLRHDLSAAEQQQFCVTMLERLAWLAAELHAQHYEFVGQVPDDGDGFSRLQEWLTRCEEIRIAKTPRVSG